MKKSLILLIACLFSVTGLAQPTLLDDNLALRSVTTLPTETVRLEYNPVNQTLYFTTVPGSIYEVNIETGTKTLRQTSANHGLGDLQGFDISSDGKFYIVGNIRDGANFTNTGVIKRGELVDGTWTWVTVAETAPYPLSNTFFDHIMNGIVVSPDNKFLYVNSGSRTDHGEVHSVDGRYPNLRETALTAKILRVPADSTDLYLEDDLATLKNSGYIYAEGIRNSFSLAFDKDNNLFAVENAGERDDPGEFNLIESGKHYGFPWRVGGNDTPMQFTPYDPDQDIMLQKETNAYQFGFFYNDPDYPTPPEGVEFTEPILNSGPDAVSYRNHITGEILDAFEEDTVISSFTAHRSMLGLTFDTNGEFGGNFTEDAFSLGFSGGNDNGFFLRWMDDPGKDLLHMELTPSGDTFTMTTTALARDFISPIDAEIIGNKMYIAEYRNGSWLNVGADTRIWEITFPAFGTSTEDDNSVVEDYSLQQNYPNPFNPATTITYELNKAGFVEIDVSDALGRHVSTLVSSNKNAQTHSVRFNATNLSSGVYFYTLRVNGIAASTKRMLLIK